ncbi:LysR substrate-binding domain-containing protein [Collimonas sp. NPDC087041]|uniref:LysR substrate-binding domain-containing protein n=1 Tax=Collimonas sp. NPDC087041 TaxID=3363960 RepID=UPI003829D865
MDSRYLKSLIAVVDRGSIADAARAENLTSAAISQRIQALERELGFELLSRIGHAAKATEACLGILPRARRIVREVDLMPDDADPSGLTGTIKLGAISTALTGLLPSALRALMEQAPKIKPRVIPGTSNSLYKSLLHNEIDAAILVAPAFELPKSLSVVSLKKEPLVLLSKKKSRENIATILQKYPYIRYDPQSWGGRFAEKYLADQGILIDPLFDLDALEAIAMLVAEGVGVSLVPRWSGLERIAENCVVTPVVGNEFTREIVLLTRENERPHMMAALLQALRT